MGVRAAPSCPVEDPAIRTAARNKLYLYFPTADDSGFPAQTNCTLGTANCFGGVTVRPLKAFDISQLSSYTGTVGDLRDSIRDGVTDDYCEFNVQVLETTSVPPTTFPRRATIGIGADSNVSASGTLFGVAQEVDIGDGVAVDYARVFGGSYQSLAGGAGGALNGANSTLQRWAFSIGGTAAHEAGHTYGLQHNDDFLQNFPSSGCNDGTDQTKAGEDPLTRHLMAQGCHFTDEQRAGFRRHFSDVTFSILASNVGLTLETIHNWDLTNPNSANATQIRFDVLSPASSLTLTWSYGGGLSPWNAPTVSGPLGTTNFQGTVFNRFQVTWSSGKAWNNGPSGVVPGGTEFHVGAAFSGVNFSVPNPIVVTKIALLDGGGNPLTLQPRMPGYDTGALDVASGDFRFNIFNTDNLVKPLQIKNLLITQLPRVASIEEMVPGGQLASWQNLPIAPWSVSRNALCAGREGDCTATLSRTPRAVVVGSLGKGRHIAQSFDGKCQDQPALTPRDSTGNPDVNNCPRKGFSLDLFPSTMIYVTATVVDPTAKHWDPVGKTFITGPLESRLFYQFAGRHPDLNRNGIDDYIDIATGTSHNESKNGVPDDARRCAKQLSLLETAERNERNQTLLVADAERRHLGDWEVSLLRKVLRKASALRIAAYKEFGTCEQRHGVRIQAADNTQPVLR
jgi:hypothetical protein